MNGAAFDEELWLAILGPPPNEPPAPPRQDLAHNFAHDGHDALTPHLWPQARGGPAGGVFWFRALERRLSQAKGCAHAAQQIGDDLQQALVSDRVRAMAMHPLSGEAYEIPASDWQGAGDRTRKLWHTGVHWAGAKDGVPCDVYLIEGEQPAGALPGAGSTELEAETPQHRRKYNLLVQAFYLLARAYFKGGDQQGIGSNTHRFLEKAGLSLSDDTVRKWLSEGREQLPNGGQKDPR